jgi:hypothetical protein
MCDLYSVSKWQPGLVHYLIQGVAQWPPRFSVVKISGFKLPFTFKEMGFFLAYAHSCGTELGCKYFSKKYFESKLE